MNVLAIAMVIGMFIAFPLLAVNTATKDTDINTPSISKYNNKDLSMASEVGVTCTTESILKMIEKKDSDEYTMKKIRKCVKDVFDEADWKYEP